MKDYIGYGNISVLKQLIHLTHFDGAESVSEIWRKGWHMIILDYQDRRPLYEQVTEKFRTLILKGILKPGERMPSVRQMAMELSINPNTIHRAYMTLEQEGLIYPVKGKGNFVADADKIRKKNREEVISELEDVVNKGLTIGMEEEELLYIVSSICKEGRQ